MKVKIILEKNETEEQAKEQLAKAFGVQASGILHSNDKFEDPAMSEVHQKVLKKHQDTMSLILKEIEKLLKAENK